LTVHNGSSSPATVKTARSTDEGGRGLLVVDRRAAHWGIDTAHNGDKSFWALFELQHPRTPTVFREATVSVQVEPPHPRHPFGVKA
jgi:hypothetical protein